MAKGKNFLKVTGILMIIFGAISIIVSVLGIVALSAISNMGVATIALITSLISSALELVTGILGVKNCDKPEKAKICIIFGIIVLVLAIVGVVLGAIGGSTSVVSIIISIICSIAIPVLYLIGAFKNKTA